MSSNNYQILKELGKGTYSHVYEVKCKSTNIHFAMKKIELQTLTTKEKGYTDTEIHILKTIQHPYIIKFEKSFKEANTLYIIMELAQCGDLQMKLDTMRQKNESFHIRTIWKYTYQILSALQALHSLNIIHRDIKASNIFIIDENTVKLGDFNIGKVADYDGLATQIGTPAMMSPEVWLGESYSIKADIWSLGCVVYQLATLTFPFSAPNFPTLFTKIINVQYQKPKSFPVVLTAFIEKLLQRDPNLRPSCEDLLKLKCFSRFTGKSSESLKKNSGLAVKSINDLIVQKKISLNEFSPMVQIKIGRKKSSFLKEERKKASPVRIKLSPVEEYGILGRGNEGYGRRMSKKVNSFDKGKGSIGEEDGRMGKYLKNIQSVKNGFRNVSPVLEEIGEYGARYMAKVRMGLRKCDGPLSSTPKPYRKYSILFK